MIHHTLSFTVVINIVMGWTFTMKLLGGRECRSPVGQGLKTAFSRRLSGAPATRLTPEMLLVRPLSAINLSLLFSSSLVCSQVAQQLVSSYMASHRKIWDVILSLSFSIRASITTCLSHASSTSRRPQKLTVPHQDTAETSSSEDDMHHKVSQFQLKCFRKAESDFRRFY